MVSVRDLLAESRIPRLEVQMILQHVLHVSRAWLIAHDTEPLPSDAVLRCQDLINRRLVGQPMAYLMGTREFMGLEFAVSPAVLIPRPDTELLVETAVQYLEGRGPVRVLELGVGSGAIAVSVALACPQATVVATDLSPAALHLAQDNARHLSAAVEFLCGSWYDALLHQPVFDLILSNPPYIASNDPHLTQGDLRFEPAMALTDGADGLQSLRQIVAGAGRWLKPGGALWMEHGWDQAGAVRGLLQRAGFSKVVSKPDLAGIERVSGGIIYN
ncbi:MAG: peptide chain release factor N(5)-glutamine methyltransferase [Paralcaligenes sp.]